MTNQVDWVDELAEQTDWLWRHQIRQRLTGLSDEEYFWQPVGRGWNVHPRGEPGAAIQAGAGAMVIDFEYPEPVPAPVTTIAWRLGHVIVGVLLARVAGHFGGKPVSYESHTYAATADEALAQLDSAYAQWLEGVRSLNDEALAKPCGPSEGIHADMSMAALVLHINRELIHHLAEVALLRDLYAHR